MNGGLRTWLEGSALAEFGIGEKDIQDALGSRYEVLSFLGAGASACVFKVADLSAGREVKAAKLAPLVGRHQAVDPRDAARAEFTLASRFDHPNLARYFDLDIPPEGQSALVTMEFVDGVPFGAGVGQKDTVTACELMVELLRGLAFLHDAGFVHGDVKPGNILCGTSGSRPWAKLLDFHLTLRARGTAGGGARGTLRYMAPEVIAGQAPEARSDLYSAGVLFYEALSGRALFEGPPRELAAQHLAAPTARAEDAGELGIVLERLLSKHPDGRYRNASEAIAAIAAAAGGNWLAETQETLLGRVRSAPLVGRDHALNAFSEFLHLPGDPGDSAKVFLIQGRQGLGKTRLLRECQVQAQWAGLRTLLLQRAETSDALLDGIDRWVGPGNVGQGTEDAGTELPPLPASVQTDRQDGLAHLPAALLRRCDRLADRLVDLADRRRAALFLDDVEGLPPDAIECILFLIRAMRRSPIAFGLAVSDIARVGGALRGALEIWRQEGLVIDVPLDELSEENRRHLIQAALPNGTPPTAIDALAEASGGSPEVMTLTLEHLTASGRLTADASGGMLATGDFVASLPEGLAQLTTKVVESVDANARRTLELLAVGGEVDAEVLAAAAGVGGDVLPDMLRKGPVAPLVSLRQTDRAVLCKLQHPRLADALLEHATRRHVRGLHDKLADAIESRGGGAVAGAAANVAKHRLQGRSPQRGVRLASGLLAGEDGRQPEVANLELAQMALSCARGAARIGLLEIAGDLNCARGRFSEAIGPFRGASRAPHLAAPDRVRLLRKFGNAYAESGAYAKARHVLTRALKMCRGVQSPHTAEMASIMLLLARTDSYQSKYRAALENYERAKRLGLEVKDEHLVAKALHGLGATYLELRALQPSCRALLRARRKFRKAGDTVGAARVMATLGYLAMLRQDWQRSIDFLRQALPPLKAGGRLTEAGRALSYLGAVHQKLCAWDQAAEHYQSASVLYERLGYVPGQATVLVNLSQLSASRGWLESAIAQAERAQQVLPGDARMCCYAMNRLARAQYALGDLPAARETSIAAADLAVASDLPVPLESAYRTLGEVEALQGEWAAAEKHLRSALSICRRNSWTEREAVCLARSAELAIASGDLSSALSLAEAAHSKAKHLSHGSVKAVAQMVKGKVLLAKNLPEEALPCLIAAEEVFATTRVWDDLVEIASCLGRTYAAVGRLRFAALCYRLALETVEHVASHLRSPANRALFLTDPRRTGLFEAASALRLRTGDLESA